MKRPDRGVVAVAAYLLLFGSMALATVGLLSWLKIADDERIETAIPQASGCVTLIHGSRQETVCP